MLKRQTEETHVGKKSTEYNIGVTDYLGVVPSKKNSVVVSVCSRHVVQYFCLSCGPLWSSYLYSVVCVMWSCTVWFGSYLCSIDPSNLDLNDAEFKQGLAEQIQRVMQPPLIYLPTGVMVLFWRGRSVMTITGSSDYTRVMHADMLQPPWGNLSLSVDN